jgi:hypothetical protein
MPKNLSSTGESFPTQTAPIAGEPRTAAGIELPLQNSADRTAYLKDRLDFLDATKEGARRLRRFASIAALKASTDHDEGTVAQVDGVGLYQYDSASAVAELSPLVLAPTDVGGGAGRWLVVGYGMLDVANGIPKLDGSAKLPTARLAAADGDGRIVASAVRNGLVDLQFLTITSASTTSTTLVDISGTLSVTAAIGDRLEISLSCKARNTSGGAEGQLKIVLTQPDTNPLAVDAMDFNVASDTNVRCAVGIAPLTQNGIHTVKLQHRAISTGTMNTDAVRIVTRLWRP